MKPRPTRQYLPAKTYQAIPGSQDLPGNILKPSPTRQYLEAKTYYEASILKSEPK
jgi:hypothetical protein